MDDEPLIQRAAIALLALVFLGASINKPASAKEVPKIPTPTEKATATSLPISSPTPTASPAPTSTPTPPPTQTPTPDPNDVEYWTALWTVEQVMLWEPYAKMIIEQYEYNLDLALVLSIIAAESGGDQSVVSYAGAVGLMQVIDRPWYDINPAGGPWGNMVLGMRILEWAIDNHGLEMGLAAYNCSLEGIANNACGPTGGVYYSEKVREFWLPLFIEALEE